MTIKLTRTNPDGSYNTGCITIETPEGEHLATLYLEHFRNQRHLVITKRLGERQSTVHVLAELS